MKLSPASRAVVYRWSRRASWFDVADLEQEAAFASIEAGCSYQPDRGASPDTWETRLVAIALSRLVAEAKAPVSLPKAKGASFDRAAGSGRVPMFVQLGDGSDVEHPALAAVAHRDHRPLEDCLDTLRAVAELHRLLERESEAARAVLLGEEKPANVAKRMGLAVAKVYAETARAMRNLRAALCHQFAKG